MFTWLKKWLREGWGKPVPPPPPRRGLVLHELISALENIRSIHGDWLATGIVVAADLDSGPITNVKVYDIGNGRNAVCVVAED